MGDLTGRVALVTGAGRGIGEATARALAAAGARVICSDLTAPEDLAAELGGLALAQDVTDEGDWARAMSFAREQAGGLDILVNNAARQQTQPTIGDITSEAFDATMKTNVYAPFWLTKAAVERMSEGAVIVNTSSEQAGDPSEDLVDYAMTRAAVLNFTKSMAKQLAPKGIRVNAVAPGPFWTPLQVSGGATPEKLQTFGAQSPMGRPGQPAEIAGLFVAAADPWITYSTGQIFGATGGGGQPA